MKWIAVLLLFAVPALAQDADKSLEQAKKLEAKAEKLLDQGKRAEAFEALAKASELRRKAQGEAKPAAKKPDETEARTTDKPVAKPKPSPNPKKADPVEAAHAQLDLALRKGDLEAARIASERLHAAREAQAKRIVALERRLRSMEQQMAEIRQLLAGEKRPK
jgi:hypothetical protein